MAEADWRDVRLAAMFDCCKRDIQSGDHCLLADDRHRASWIAQRRCGTLPVETSDGSRYPCLGVFTLESKTVGVYGRVASKPLVDENAQNGAVLLREVDSE
jgi:hypothetical protein